MAGGDGSKVRVTCVECHFSTVVALSEQLPADVIKEHGRETGHKLTTEEV